MIAKTEEYLAIFARYAKGEIPSFISFSQMTISQAYKAEARIANKSPRRQEEE